MAKTNPIGVRFDVELWERFNKMGINSAQKILNFLEDWYVKNIDKVIETNKQPENKKRILEERNEVNNRDFEIKSAKIEKSDGKHTAKFELEINDSPHKETIPEKYLRLKQEQLKNKK